MNPDKDSFSQQYTALLGEYANSLEETPLAAIESLGQQMVQLGMPPEEIGEMHDHAIAELIACSAIDPDKIRTLNPNLPVIFLTGYDKEQVLGGSEQIARSQVLSKPVRFDVLNHTLRQMLDG